MFSLMHQYLPCGLVSEENYPELNRRITDFEYEMAESALLASGIEDGFVQDSDSAVKDYIPPFMVSFSSKESDNVPNFVKLKQEFIDKPFY